MKKFFKIVLKVLVIIVIIYASICIGYLAWVGLNVEMSTNVNHRSRGEYGKFDESEYVSIISLIASPEKYNGKKVEVIGVPFFQSDGPDRGSQLFVTKDDYKYFITKNALSFEPNYNVLKTNYKDLKNLNGKFIRVQGIFNMDHTGAWGLNSGGIDNITFIKFYESKPLITEEAE